jgi:hypothetical protein
MGHDGRCHDAARRTNAEEAQAARFTAIGGETEKTPDEQQSGSLDAVPRQALQIEIAATGTVSEADECQGNARGVKAFIAESAAPGTQARGGGEQIGCAAAARTEAIGAAALWTYHRKKYSILGFAGKNSEIQSHDQWTDRPRTAVLRQQAQFGSD